MYLFQDLALRESG